MKKLLKIVFIITSIFIVLKIFFQISFSYDLINEIILTAFGLSGAVYLTILFPETWVKILFVCVIAGVVIIGWYSNLIFGYESQIHKKWNFDNYNIQLENRIQIAGPGCFWFLVNKKILGGVLERRIETRKYQAVLPDPPQIFEFATKNDPLKVECCKNNLIILPDSMSLEEKLDYIK
ncbi:hypothetical protein MATR_04130 [Marivirga tractuosa]|uniref:Uncharacterized protein n=1 Tax=Marivirga tractuosa (strain ATCC 23168 / DSM 4126 / NBRC 15989 / NCIMB 1408 / VKM B-1430 / H-43) TaxID=643867 RepID=E4TTC2_MARTH|nr:hypothetical protein [Marivirga tractuosa]ADR21952.1 hypothetical protein Ftrac_1967 [Marivirga tractuosa DSM 4126]BDD13588.1 hypothetical protein MATR_04130 [Marivirga tractuosa]